MSIITRTYDGMQVDFTDEAWFNATEVAKRFGKRPVDWLKLDETKAYIAALAAHLNCEPASLLKTKRGRYGSGTWMHPKLGVAFARWLDLGFAVWCDLQVDSLLRGDALDHRRLRHQAAASFKVMNAIRFEQLRAQGKEPKRHHFINEARLVNYALTGEFSGQDRDAMTVQELDDLARIEERNAVLIGMGLEYSQRKTELQSFTAKQLRG